MAMTRYKPRPRRTPREQGARARPRGHKAQGRYEAPPRPQARPRPMHPPVRPPRTMPKIPFAPGRAATPPRIIPMGVLPWWAAAFGVATMADSFFAPNPNYVPVPGFHPDRPERMWDFKHGPNTYPGSNYWPPAQYGQNNGIAYSEAGTRGAETGEITGQSNWHLVDGPPGYPIASFHDRVSYVIPQLSGNTNLTAQTHAWFRNTSANYGPMAPRMPAKWHTFPNPMREPASDEQPTEWPAEGPPAPAPHPGEGSWQYTPNGPGTGGKPRPSGSKPPAAGVKEKKVMSRAKKIGIALWGMLDDYAELSEIVGGFYDALPEDVRQKWNCADGINIGQYGTAANKCMGDALWHNWHLLDPNEAFMNVAKNIAEDMTIGAFHKFMSSFVPAGFSWQKTAMAHALSKTDVEAYMAKHLKELFRFLGLED